MKKVLLTICAMAAVMACTKTEVTFEQPEQISFAPVTQKNTKAATVGNSYPTLDFYVFANAGGEMATDGTMEIGDLPGNNSLGSYTDTYINNAKFTNPNNGIYTGENCFWPTVKKLVFAGVSASGNVGAVTNPADVAMDFANNQLTIGQTTPYVQLDDADNNDLMWFPTTTAYDKSTETVPVTMKHACALLKFNFIAADGNTAGWKIKKVVVNGLQKSGKAVCGAESVEWTPSGTTSTFTVYSDDPGTPIKVADSDPNTVDYITPENEENNTVVIPQTPATASITYTYESQAGQEIDEIATVSLSLGKENEVEKKWQSGYCYTYNVTIGVKAIKIEPSGSTWTDGSTPTNTI